MKNVVRICEHDRICIGDSSTEVNNQLSAAHASELRKLEKHLPKNTFEWGHKSIKWGSFVGLLPLSDVLIEVSPKLHKDESQVAHGREVLLKILAETGVFKLHVLSRASVGLNKHSLLDLFILDFCQELKSLIYQGMDRAYQVHEENLPVLKGKLLVHEQIKHNHVLKNRLYCEHDELSHNTPLNQLIRATLVALQNATSTHKTVQQVEKLRYHFEAVKEVSPKTVQSTEIYFNRNNERFKGVAIKSRRLLSGLYPDLLSGKQEGVGLLFNMNQLFENWLGVILKKCAIMSNLKYHSQGPVRYVADRAYDSENRIQNSFRLKPDYVISCKDNTPNSTRPILVADAKWKMVTSTASTVKINASDIHQVQSYASIYRSKMVALIYPMYGDNSPSIEFKLNDVNETILLVVSVPLDKKIQEIVQEISDVFSLSEYVRVQQDC